ncbi:MULTISPECIES: hypothetical protein [unclassified Pseudomonas]|uniref:hypothetical protein n=1 Tax=unclassified Pseudomonas TaxID=196821 RepID=UPI00244A3117|nr:MULTISPECIES: hypothetical protein [unclassified Pseudomonas]MDG9924870.1 hypothetical protein [Pseudomonas sp. GD04045]MDH0036151.1 hypothetical protein [Pseudomonas sp. GD04019]
MTEFIVMASGVLLILFLVVPMLAKLLDMSFQTQQMARYMAWERTVWYDNGDQPSETTEPGNDIAVRSDSAIDGSAQKRLLTFTSSPEILSASDVSGVPAGTQHALWRWSSGGQMLNGGGLTGNSLNPEETPSFAYDVLGVYNEGMGLLTEPLTMIGVGGGADGNFLQVAHPQDNYFTPSVSASVNLANTGLESSALPDSLTITAKSAILADGWNAQGEHHFKSRSDDFAIGTLMDNGVVNAMISFIGVFEPSFRDVDFGYIGTDPIPEAETKCDFGFCYFDEEDD